MWRIPGRYVCADCEKNVSIMRLLGNCGDEVPDGNRLPLMVGPGVTRCPVAMGTADPEVLHLAALIPGPHGGGLLDGAPRWTMPPRYRAACELGDAWVAAWKATREARHA